MKVYVSRYGDSSLIPDLLLLFLEAARTKHIIDYVLSILASHDFSLWPIGLPLVFFKTDVDKKVIWIVMLLQCSHLRRVECFFFDEL